MSINNWRVEEVVVLVDEEGQNARGRRVSSREGLQLLVEALAERFDLNRAIALEPIDIAAHTKWVAKNFNFSRRRDKLRWSFQREDA